MSVEHVEATAAARRWLASKTARVRLRAEHAVIRQTTEMAEGKKFEEAAVDRAPSQSAEVLPSDYLERKLARLRAGDSRSAARQARAFAPWQGVQLIRYTAQLPLVAHSVVHALSDVGGSPAILSDTERQHMQERLALAHKTRRVEERGGDRAYRARQTRGDEQLEGAQLFASLLEESQREWTEVRTTLAASRQHQSTAHVAAESAQAIEQSAALRQAADLILGNAARPPDEEAAESELAAAPGAALDVASLRAQLTSTRALFTSARAAGLGVDGPSHPEEASHADKVSGMSGSEGGGGSVTAATGEQVAAAQLIVTRKALAAAEALWGSEWA